MLASEARIEAAIAKARAQLGDQWGALPASLGSPVPAGTRGGYSVRGDAFPVYQPGAPLTAWEAASAALRAEAGREYAGQQSALDAPFKDVQKSKFYGQQGGGADAHASEASGRGSAVALGLVKHATSGSQAHEEARRLPREKLLINREAQRVKRMRCGVGHAARLIHFDAHCERHAQRWNLKFLTLTYARTDGWRAGHFSAFRNALKLWCRRRGIRLRFVWVAELQGRGAVHYHMVVWLPKGHFLPRPDECGWWPHGATKTETARSPVGYLTKYASKLTAADAHGFPKGARMFGHGGLPQESRRHVRYWQSPIWVREALGGRADIRKVVGGYMDRITGEFLASPWRVCVGPDGQVWTYRIDQQEQELAA